jgi:hypothetical protein
MKKKIFILMLLTVATVRLSAQDQQQVSAKTCPQVTAVVADGNADEWAMDWQKDPDNKMSYNICFDDNNLYVRMKTADDMVKRKIGFFGLTLWMDPKGKKKKKLGLRFPTGAEGKEKMEALRETGERQSKMSSSERAEFQKGLSKTLIEDVELIELVGLTDDPLTSSRSGITNGIKVGIALSAEGDYVYEAIIPFKSFRLSKSSLSILGIGFETGKYVIPTQNAPAAQGVGAGGYGAAGQNNGAYGMGARSQMGGGYGGQGGRGMGPSRQSNPMGESTSQWTSIKFK